MSKLPAGGWSSLSSQALGGFPGAQGLGLHRGCGLEGRSRCGAAQKAKGLPGLPGAPTCSALSWVCEAGKLGPELPGGDWGGLA